MTTETQKPYNTNDLIGMIREEFPMKFPEQAGALSATLTSILIHVEVCAPEMFQEIMEFEMRCMKRMYKKQMYYDRT